MKIYRDKAKLFECSVDVDGTTLDKVKSRLIFDFGNDTFKIIALGEVSESGKCRVEIPPMKGIKAESGKVTLEIIAENMLFVPWASDFELDDSIKIGVENVAEKDMKKNVSESAVKVKVVVPQEKKEMKIKDDIAKEDAIAMQKMISLVENMNESQKKFISEKVSSVDLTSEDKWVGSIFENVDHEDETIKMLKYYHKNNNSFVETKK